MSDLDALLAGLVADPETELRWLILADWLEEFGEPHQGELLRLHRWLLGTCLEPASRPERVEWHARIVELLEAGVRPCVPQRSLTLPGGVELVGSYIPPGSFLMGGGVLDADNPVHQVTITNGYFMGIYPVTQAQWRAVAGTDPSNYAGDSRPVECVSWDVAQAYCWALGKISGAVVRLPTEAEFEYAVRAGTTSEYHFGESPTAKRSSYYDRHALDGSGEVTARGGTTAVGSFVPTPWGLHDCQSNVMQWCADWYDASYYRRSPTENPLCEDGSRLFRSARGGSWLLRPPEAPSQRRIRFVDTDRHSYLGFRVVFLPPDGR